MAFCFPPSPENKDTILKSVITQEKAPVVQKVRTCDVRVFLQLVTLVDTAELKHQSKMYNCKPIFLKHVMVTDKADLKHQLKTGKCNLHTLLMVAVYQLSSSLLS